MKPEQSKLSSIVRTSLGVGSAVGLLALGAATWAANDLDVSRKLVTNGGFDTHNMAFVVGTMLKGA